MNPTVAAAIELGIPACAALAAVLSRRYRSRAIVVLGAVTPQFILLIWDISCHILYPSNYKESVEQVWLYSFVAIVFIAVLGMFVSSLRRPANLAARFVLGLVVLPSVAVPMNLGGML